MTAFCPRYDVRADGPGAIRRNAGSNLDGQPARGISLTLKATSPREVAIVDGPRHSQAVEEHARSAIALEEVDIRAAMWTLGWPSNGAAPGTMGGILHGVINNVPRGWSVGGTRTNVSSGSEGRGRRSSRQAGKGAGMEDSPATGGGHPQPRRARAGPSSGRDASPALATRRGCQGAFSSIRYYPFRCVWQVNTVGVQPAPHRLLPVEAMADLQLVAP